MNPHTLFSLAAMAFVVLIGVLVVVILVYLIKLWQAKIQIEKDAEFRKLKLDAAEAAKKIRENQLKTEEELQALKKRIVAVEKILQEVE
ncbi:MAG: hypothetical protein WB502_00770 [Thermoactinomyces sp.]